MSWHRLDPTWTATEQQAAEGLPHELLSPLWQLLVLGDGSPTRTLRILSGCATQVDVEEMRELGEGEDDGAPEAVAHVVGPHLRRTVWLKPAGGPRLMYATSWWNLAAATKHMRDQSAPIWANLSRSRTELYRDIRSVFRGTNAALQAAFGTTEELWGRTYLFWHADQPLCMIYEVFSPDLAMYLGPQRQPLAVAAATDAASEKRGDGL